MSSLKDHNSYPDGDGILLHNVFLLDGELYPNFSAGDIKSKLKGTCPFNVYQDDVWIIGFPKSGAHWTHDIVEMVRNGTSDHVKTNMEDNFFELRNVSQLEGLSRPRTLSCHFPVNRFPSEVLHRKCKLILNIRNPKDVAVSMFNHCKAVKLFQYDGRFDAFLKVFTKVGMYGPWFSSVRGWYEYSKTNEDILVLKYEDMIKDLPSAVKAVAAHLEVPLTPELCTGIADQCQFSVMKDRRTTSEKQRLMFKDKEASLFRKGKVGDWKTWFTVAENEEFDRIYEQEMMGCDLKLDFEL